jgi:hypothetical protein
MSCGPIWSLSFEQSDSHQHRRIHKTTPSQSSPGPRRCWLSGGSRAVPGNTTEIEDVGSSLEIEERLNWLESNCGLLPLTFFPLYPRFSTPSRPLDLFPFSPLIQPRESPAFAAFPQPLRGRNKRKKRKKGPIGRLVTLIRFLRLRIAHAPAGPGNPTKYARSLPDSVNIHDSGRSGAQVEAPGR